MKNKDKKPRKKIHKRKMSDAVESVDSDKMRVDSVVEIKTQMSSLDLRVGTIYDLKGRKGHINYYAKQTIDVGVYYFEVTPTSLEYNFAEYVYDKRIDEFSKAYYETVLTNIKNYSPNI